MNAKQTSFIQSQAFEAVKFFKEDRSTAIAKVKQMLEANYDIWDRIFRTQGYPQGTQMFWAEVYKATEVPC